MRETAKRMHDLGQDYSIAASEELTQRDGFVYVITHPRFPGYVKIGRAFDPESRLRGYQTGCPERAYELRHSAYFTDCNAAELEIHARLDHHRAEGEWFAISERHAVRAITSLWEIL